MAFLYGHYELRIEQFGEKTDHEFVIRRDDAADRNEAYALAVEYAQMQKDHGAAILTLTLVETRDYPTPLPLDLLT